MSHDNKETAAEQKPAVHPRYSRAAVASGVLGVTGIATLWIFGLGLLISAVGAVCGHMAHFYIRCSAKRLKGRGLASFGLGTSYLAMLFFPLLLGIGFALFPVWKAHQGSQVPKLEERSKMNASKLFVACESYARSHRDQYPEKWDDLSGKYLSDGELRDLIRITYPDGQIVSFELVPHERPVLNGVGSSVVVIQQTAPPSVKRVVVVSADGKTALIPNPNRP